MKKLSVILAAGILVANGIKAQDLKSKKGESYLPEKGDWSIGFNPNGLFSYVGNIFNGTENNAAPTVDFLKNGVFVGKKFITSREALRVVANVSVSTSKMQTPTYLNTTILPNPAPVPGESDLIAPLVQYNTTLSNSNFGLTLGLGKEYRKGKTRLQGYYGADLMFQLTSSKSESAVQYVLGDSAYIDYANPNVPVIKNLGVREYTKTVANKNGMGFSFIAQGFMGAEYFVFPKISIGAQYQYGLSFNYQALSKIETKYTGIGLSRINDNDLAQKARYSNSTTNGPKDNGIGIGGVGVASLSMNFHF